LQKSEIGNQNLDLALAARAGHRRAPLLADSLHRRRDRRGDIRRANKHRTFVLATTTRLNWSRL